ncbi:MAG: hypothetical protein HPY51_12855 [Candidatus Omnitrophica bacterium]|nr:hypothetical protein [Candidatus Omnitrophota bacterium]
MRSSLLHRLYFSSGILAGMLLLWPSMMVQGQAVPEISGEAVLETTDGMIVAGMIKETSEAHTILHTPFGELRIPLDQIRRINGDQFSPERGIIREHRITLSPNGNAVMEYLQPVAGRPGSDSVQILVPGNVLNIMDLQEDSLPFLAKEFDGYSRCTVPWPRYRLPAVWIRAHQSEAATLEDGRMHYAYRYSPRTDQTFRLKLTLPPGSSDIQAFPGPVHLSENQILWEQTVQRQQKLVFQISFLVFREPVDNK